MNNIVKNIFKKLTCEPFLQTTNDILLFFGLNCKGYYEQSSTEH